MGAIKVLRMNELLCDMYTSSCTYVSVAVSVAGSSLWNRLPPSARAFSSNLSPFLSLLKTCLFSWS